MQPIEMLIDFRKEVHYFKCGYYKAKSTIAEAHNLKCLFFEEGENKLCKHYINIPCLCTYREDISKNPVADEFDAKVYTLDEKNAIETRFKEKEKSRLQIEYGIYS